ncbi:MAG: hypothetical protein IPM46_15730 [Flavobacteriales bacterium]|nr:hypothetical protein [Flavobacteriales bacterium]
MRHYLTSIAFLAVLAVSAQTPELLGQERWPDGTLRATRFQENGRVHFITYHENGRVKEMGCFRKGRRDGVWKQFSDSGALLAQAGFRNGLRQGVWEFRSHSDAVVGRLTYADGMIQRGEQFDEQGALVAMRTY